jgi:N-acetylneuraminic acid mutarotase
MGKTASLLLGLIFLTASSVIIAKPASSAKTTENSWESMASIPETSGGIRAATANGKIYVMGSSINYEYDPTRNKWTEKTSMPTPRLWFAITVYQNKIYAIGGRLSGVSFGANEVYDPSTDTWEVMKSIPASISDIDANVVADKIYIIGGGITKEPSLPVNLMYDIAKDSWTNKSRMPYPASSYASAVVNNKIYIIYGNRTQIYDARTDSWNLGASIPTTVSSAAAGATTGVMALKRIYVVGGTTWSEGMFSQGMKLTQVYDPETDTWTLGEPMPSARLGLTAAVVNDQIYAIGGVRMAVFSPVLTIMERYTPLGYGTPDPSYDGTDPEVTLISPENKTYHVTSVPLEFSVNETVSWMHYNLDNKNVTEISGNTTITGLYFGSHNLTVYATDNSGNTGVSQTIQFTVTEAPFPTTLVIASVITVAVIGIGLLVYFKKRKR